MVPRSFVSILVFIIIFSNCSCVAKQWLATNPVIRSCLCWNVLPKLASIEDDGNIDGVLVIINTVGGDWVGIMKKYKRSSFEVEAVEYELGKGMEDGFMPWTSVVTTGWIKTDNLIIFQY